MIKSNVMSFKLTLFQKETDYLNLIPKSKCEYSFTHFYGIDIELMFL